MEPIFGRIPFRYAERVSPQVAVRLPAPLLDDIDALVDSGRFETRADAIRSGIELIVDTERRERIAQSIIAGYARVPQAEEVDEELGRYPAIDPGGTGPHG